MEDISLNSLRLYYYRLKDSAYYSVIIYGSIIVVCMLLLYFVVIPQALHWFSINDEIRRTEKRLAILQNSLTVLSNTSTRELDATVKTVNEALPIDKDFALPLAAITDASLASGVTLSDYSFELTGLSNQKPGSTSIIPVSLALTVQDGVKQTKMFITELSKKLPVSSIKRWDATSIQSVVTIDFYYKSVPTIHVDDTAPLPVLSTEKNALLQKLVSWKPQIDVHGPQSATTSSGPVFPF